MYFVDKNLSGGLLSKGLQSFVRESIIKPTIVAAVAQKLAPQTAQTVYAAAPAAATVGSQAQPIVINVPSTGVSTGAATTGAAISPQYLIDGGTGTASTEMEVLKKYAPWIIGGLALILVMGKK